MRKSLKEMLRTAWGYTFEGPIDTFRKHTASTLVIALFLAPVICEVDRYMNTTRGYKVFPPTERAILNEYDKGLPGLEAHELRLILRDYGLVRRETPKEIPGVPYAH